MLAQRRASPKQAQLCHLAFRLFFETLSAALRRVVEREGTVETGLTPAGTEATQVVEASASKATKGVVAHGNEIKHASQVAPYPPFPNFLDDDTSLVATNLDLCRRCRSASRTHSPVCRV